jgi:hypothetical protein
MKNYTIRQRFEMTIGNIEYQGFAAWDDLEKLRHLTALLEMGKNLDDDFEFVENL